MSHSLHQEHHQQQQNHHLPLSPIFSTDDEFQISLGKSFLYLKNANETLFFSSLRTARLHLMRTLSASSMESYSSAFDSLTRLAVLHEVEKGYEILKEKSSYSNELDNLNKNSTFTDRLDHLLNQWGWDPRLSLMSSFSSSSSSSILRPSSFSVFDIFPCSPPSPHQELLLAVRRALLQAFHCPAKVSENWLYLCRSLMSVRKFDSALMALGNAKTNGLDPEVCLMQEGCLLRDAGKYPEALQLIEPVNLNIRALKQALKDLERNDDSDKNYQPNSHPSRPFSPPFTMSIVKLNDSSLPAFLNSESKRFLLAERILLSNQVIIPSKLKSRSEIMDRFDIIFRLRPDWAHAHFEFARFCDDLYAESQEAWESVDDKSKAGSSPSSSSSSSSSYSYSDTVKGHFQYLSSSIQSYLKAIHIGAVTETSEVNQDDSSATGLRADSRSALKHSLQEALPRLLTMWLAYTSIKMPPPVLPSSLASKSQQHQQQHQAYMEQYKRQEEHLLSQQEKINSTISMGFHSIPTSTWLPAITQLVSRTGHRNAETLKLIKMLLIRMLVYYPYQSVWHVAGLLDSYNEKRKELGIGIIQDAHRLLIGKSKKQISILTGRSSSALSPLGGDQYPTSQTSALMLIDAHRLFQNIIGLCKVQTKEPQINSDLLSDIKNPDHILVPIQCFLQNVVTGVDISSHFMTQITSLTSSNSTLSASSQSSITLQSGPAGFEEISSMFISSISKVAQVANSKAKPKTITLLTSGGRKLRFLCKQEKNGDLRKDARMMEFNATVNRLLQSHPQGRALHLRTFSVVCLNEECGIIEWVENTVCLRKIIQMAHTSWPTPIQPPPSISSPSLSSVSIYHPPIPLYPQLDFQETFKLFSPIQQRYEDNIEQLVIEYQTHILNRYRPCLHKWFLDSYFDPLTWIESTHRFTRSVSVWSVVSYIIGLGDRHTENILMDVVSGECVHVDFDCLFDKGLTLARPEIVPFRLTPNLVDAMGLMGVEGGCRQGMEVVLDLLMKNRSSLMSVLEPFLRDPTVAWSRSGRAQREREREGAPTGGGGAGPIGGGGGGGVKGDQFQDLENVDAKEALAKIDGRLRGVYNISHPHAEKILRGYSVRRQGQGQGQGGVGGGPSKPKKGVGAVREESNLPLSVQGLVERLIDEATCNENLSQMYIGWQPWM